MSRVCTTPASRTPPWVRQSSTTEALINRWQSTRDEHARDILVERYLPFARRLARKFQGSWEISDDLGQVASIGLVKAIERFDTERGVSFESFAIPTILGELKRYLRDSGWAVHVPRALQERAVKVEQTRRELSASGHAPTYQQLAEYLELTLAEVLEAAEASAAHHATSLEVPRHTEASDDNPITLADTLASNDERFELVDVSASLGSAAAFLSERERRVLALRFVQDETQAEIAEEVGLSQMQISRILRQALSRLEILMSGNEPSD
jgi:RNA polymerase sigma-B factor